MGNYITTYTGKHFEPANPEPEMIRIEDIAHALSLICRGNGHVKTFWSVGQHSINCAKEAAERGLSNRMALACLLHDAGECYMSDIPRPFKQELPDYLALEESLLDLIYVKFLGSSLTPEEQEQLKEIDDAMLWYDLEKLLDEKQNGEAPELHIAPDYSVRSFRDVEKEYLELFYHFSGEELLNTPYWIIDILPEQVPADSAGQYFAVEKYWRDTQLSDIKKKHVNMILKLNCYRDISLDEDRTVSIFPEQIADAVYNRHVNIMIDGAMIISEPDDTYLTIYNPDEELLTLLRKLAAGEGMFVWKPDKPEVDS